jgi:hypothetical protein
VVPSTVPVGALIETGHSTLALVCRRLSVSIAACEIMCRRYFLVLLQKVLICFQITGMRGEDATKKTPPRPFQGRPMGARVNPGRASSLWWDMGIALPAEHLTTRGLSTQSVSLQFVA